MADSATPSTPKMKPRIPTLTERELEYPAMPAEADGLPDGWVIRRVPRPDGGGNERIHNIFCSPSGFKFGSRAEARRFVDRVEGTGGDEAEVARTDSMRPRCAHPSCPNLALARGLCRKHRPRCAVEGCDYIVYARGRCRKCNGRGDGGGRRRRRRRRGWRRRPERVEGRGGGRCCLRRRRGCRRRRRRHRGSRCQAAPIPPS